jgi:hypothetical protein
MNSELLVILIRPYRLFLTIRHIRNHHHHFQYLLQRYSRCKRWNCCRLLHRRLLHLFQQSWLFRLRHHQLYNHL